MLLVNSLRLEHEKYKSCVSVLLSKFLQEAYFVPTWPIEAFGRMGEKIEFTPLLVKKEIAPEEGRELVLGTYHIYCFRR